MEPQRAGGKSRKYGEEGANSISDDESRTSSASSASVVSATSAELPCEDPDDTDRDEHGCFAHYHEQSEKGLPIPGTSPSSMLESPSVQVMERPPSYSHYRIPSYVFATSEQYEKGLPNLEISASSMLESPSVQEMERPPDFSRYRIPSHVFATSKPNTSQPGWSMYSNESLFSIPNMSFKREEFNMMLRSGELAMYAELLKLGELGNIANIYKSGELSPVPPMPPNTQKLQEQKAAPASTDIGVKKDDRTSEVINRNRADSSMDEPPCPASITRDTEACAPSFASHVMAKSERSSSVNSSNNQIDKPKEKDLLHPDQEEQSSNNQIDNPKEKDSSDPDQEERSKEELKTPEGASSCLPWFSCFCCP